MSWFARIETGWLLHLHVQPGARRSEIVGLHGASLKLRVQAPPVDGKANAAVIALLAERLRTAPRNLRLVAGESAREKRVAVDDPRVDPARLLDQAS